MIKYDEAYVSAWRAKAITNVDHLVIGETYYSNWCDKFVMSGLLTYNARYKQLGISYERGDGDRLGYFVKDDGNVESLLDSNIGAAYNPWLIFAFEADMLEYKAGLHISYDRDPIDDFFEEFLHTFDDDDYKPSVDLAILKPRNFAILKARA